jgi:hypothetical protein
MQLTLDVGLNDRSAQPTDLLKVLAVEIQHEQFISLIKPADLAMAFH